MSPARRSITATSHNRRRHHGPQRGSFRMTSLHVSGRTRTAARILLAALLGASALVAVPARAQDAAPSPNATVNLIHALVRKGILSQTEADTMIAQAETEAQQAQATAAAAQSAQSSARAAIAADSPASATPGTDVRYVPQFVRDQIKQEVKAEVLADARTEGLVAPGILPDWVRTIRITGDFRFRDENRSFPKDNSNSFINVNAINSGSPYDPNNSGGVAPPIRNTLQDRNIQRIRARLGLEADIAPQVTLYTRIATGSQTNPDSTNQTLGGYFTDKGIWLDRAYLDIHPFKDEDAHLLLGRMANPFKLAELVWDDDVNLDGVAASYARAVGHGLTLHVTGGAFPLSYAADDEPTTSLAKTSDDDGTKWLFAGQAGFTWQAIEKLGLQGEIAYYDYENVAGRLSPACLNTSAFCITDGTRPGYLQAGNTLFALRDVTTSDPNNPSAPQYYGLASRFRVLAASAAADYAFADALHLNLAAHYSRNLAYSADDIRKRGFNPASGTSQLVSNIETCLVPLVGGNCPAGQSQLKSGGDAWLVRATLGAPRIEKFGDWNITASYRRIDPDALLDAFTDQDFHLGGTNARGWTIGGEYGLFRHTSIGARWMSANEVSGPPLRIDLFQADLTVKF